MKRKPTVVSYFSKREIAALQFAVALAARRDDRDVHGMPVPIGEDVAITIRDSFALADAFLDRSNRK